MRKVSSKGSDWVHGETAAAAVASGDGQGGAWRAET